MYKIVDQNAEITLLKNYLLVPIMLYQKSDNIPFHNLKNKQTNKQKYKYNKITNTTINKRQYGGDWLEANKA